MAGIGLAGLLMLGVVAAAGFALLVPSGTIAAATASSAAGRALVDRFVGRSRRFRTVGGLIGVTLGAMAVSIRTDGSVSVTIALLPALAGAVLGSILAETFRIRVPKGESSASLGIRREVDYRDPVADARERLVGGISAGFAILALIEQDWTGAGLAGVVLALALIRRWAQRRVIVRGRPALDADLTAADDEVRRMAVRHGLARPAVTLMALVAAAQAASVQSGFDDVSLLGQLLGVLTLGLSLAGVVWWWTNRNFGFAAANRARVREAFTIGLVVVGVMLVVFLSRGVL